MLSRLSITRIVNLRLKKFFSGMSIKNFFDQYVSCRPSQVTVNQHIFKSDMSS